MQIGNRFRCYPTSAQAQTLLQWIGCQRHIYNAKVLEDQYFRRFARKSLQHAGQYAPIDQQYVHFKSELTPWLSEAPSIILRNGAVLWKQAYSRYFSKLGGRPVLRKKHGKQSVWLTSEVFKFLPVVDTQTGEIAGDQIQIGTNVRRDVAHKTSATLASDTRYKLFVFEALKVKNMTKRAKPNQDEQDRWIRNGARAKSGLNKFWPPPGTRRKCFCSTRLAAKASWLSKYHRNTHRRNVPHAATLTLQFCTAPCYCS
jgi:transposase